jgi:hypothetical protein
VIGRRGEDEKRPVLPPVIGETKVDGVGGRGSHGRKTE